MPFYQYKYVIRNGSQELWKIDPREEQITNSTGNSVVFDDSFNWNDESFLMPNWGQDLTRNGVPSLSIPCAALYKRSMVVAAILNVISATLMEIVIDVVVLNKSS